MSYSTILRIRMALVAHGMAHAVALYRSARPLGTPVDFCVFILGKSTPLRGAK